MDRTTDVAWIEPKPAMRRSSVVLELLMRALEVLLGEHRHKANGSAVESPADEATDAHESADFAHSPTSYLRRVAVLTRLAPQREAELFTLINSADASDDQRRGARAEVVRAHLWLVPLIVRRYYPSGIGFDDLVAEGNIGLYRAIDRFDASRQVRFSSYAKWWVIEAVTASMSANAFPLRVPRKVAQALSRQRREDGSQPLRDDAPVSDREFDAAVADDAWASEDDIAQQCDPAPQPDQIVALRQALRQLTGAVAQLPPRERRVIEGRYGLHGRTEETLQQIGAELGLTAERVRTLQISAMAMLRMHLADADSPARRAA
jgi:RNA polymerase sigma factor (sigma-70 family)